MSKQKTHLRLGIEIGGVVSPDICCTLEGILLDLPIGHRINVEIGPGTYMPKGFYQVYQGPFDHLYMSLKEDIFERCYDLKYVDEAT